MAVSALLDELKIPHDGESCEFGSRELIRKVKSGENSWTGYIGDWDCLAVLDNLDRDSLEYCRPSVEQVFSSAPFSARTISGSIAYLGMSRHAYRYDVSRSFNKEYVIRLKIQFVVDRALRLSTDDRKDFERRLAEAAGIWTSTAQDRGLPFRLEVAWVESDAHFTVKLRLEGDRLRYDKHWSWMYSPATMAHELGHMLGLDDEYRQLRVTLPFLFRKTTRRLIRKREYQQSTAYLNACSPDSFMCCESGCYKHGPKPYHYYLVLRRLYCDSAKGL